MNVSLHILEVRGKGVQCCLAGSDTGDGASFWLPRSAVEWAEAPEPGAKVKATIPRWLALKHRQLVTLRGQYAFPLTPLPGLDPEKAKEPIPMADFPADIGEGALFKNRDKTKPSQPDYFGKAEVNGVKLRVSAWLKDSKKNPGQKYMSLSFRLDESQDQRQQPRPAGGQSFADADIPF